ncbi:Saccharopine dehydrogenase-domain-containing protein [Abortiporus biennis]|nr:Saccharopine dehydrogenase-domain-containing protein [Abortiporus biennis]
MTASATFLRRAPISVRTSRARSYSTPGGGKLTIGIRREDPTRIWERRCPLTPDAVHDLVHKQNVDVLIQNCERRVWPVEEFIKAGAQVHPTLSPANITLGIKETPLNEVLTDAVSGIPRTHFMFSHTTKGQAYNMELLNKFLSNGALSPTLVDYELLIGPDGKRTVGFGWFAGVAGALESLSALAHALLELGVSSPFLYAPRPHTHPSLPSILHTLRTVVGAQISSQGTPKSLGPIVIGVTGTGKVATGALDLLKELPICMVNADQLDALVSDPATDLHKIYVVHVLPEDYFVRKDGSAYSRSDYYSHPQEYISTFHSRIAPYLTLLLHGAGWAPTYPRLMTNEQLALAMEKAIQVGNGKLGRFVCVGDISCDVEGGLEFLSRHSTLSSPFYTTKPPSHPAHLPEITMMSVDILPTALPLEASEHFSNVLYPYLTTYLNALRGTQGEGEAERWEALERATVATEGELKEKWKWLEEGPLGVWRDGMLKTGTFNVLNDGASKAKPSTPSISAKKESATIPKKKKVLVLGSGMVAGPAIDEICSWKDVELVVASNILPEASRLTRKHPNASAKLIDVSDRASLGDLIGEADVVISLLPVAFHPKIGELCLEKKKHLVTASYISDAMRGLHEKAESSDLIFLNEIGLDPGIDHCSAIKMLSELKAQNKQVVSFTSFCGGLPAPDCAEGIPLGYKFSWSPRGVLLASLNSARFKLMNSIEEIEGKNILVENFPDLPVSDVLRLEGIANRDSLPYADAYSLGALEDIRTLVRGTIRYSGFSALMHQFKCIGLVETSPDSQILPTSWSDFVRLAMEKKLNHPIPFNDPHSFQSALNHLIPNAKETSEEFISNLDWFGISPFSSPSSSRGIALPIQPTAPIDILTTLLTHKLSFDASKNERDLVILSHEIVSCPSTSPHVTTHAPSPTQDEEIHTSSLVVYGDNESSAMAKCVGLPVAFATRCVLDGVIKVRGVHGPGVERGIWERVLSSLEEKGLGMNESVARKKGLSGGGIVESALHRAHALRRGALSF